MSFFKLAWRNTFLPVFYDFFDGVFQRSHGGGFQKEALDRHRVGLRYGLSIGSGSKKKVGYAFRLQLLVCKNFISQLKAVYSRHINI
jgi:hypothetical protein